MSREECYELLKPYIKVLHDSSHVVEHLDAKFLLGEERFNAMMKDPIRNLPKNRNATYFWNVLDYCSYDPITKKVHKLPYTINPMYSTEWIEGP